MTRLAKSKENDDGFRDGSWEVNHDPHLHDGSTRFRDHEEASYDCGDDHYDHMELDSSEETTNIMNDTEDDDDCRSEAVPRSHDNAFDTIMISGIGTDDALLPSSSTTTLPIISSSSSIHHPPVMGPLMSHSGRHDEVYVCTVGASTTASPCRNSWDDNHRTTTATSTTTTSMLISSVLEQTTFSPTWNGHFSSYCFCCGNGERSTHDSHGADFAPFLVPYENHNVRPDDDRANRIKAVLEIIQDACDLLDDEEYLWE